jgi:hypothetical protein
VKRIKRTADEKNVGNEESFQPRTPGLLAGQIEIRPDFDEPLSEFLEALPAVDADAQ